MMGPKSLRRRKFLRLAASAAASSAAVSCGSRKGPWHFLTLDEAAILAAVSERIVPADQDPGGGWAGVVNFIDRQLAGPYRRFQRTYRQGLIAVEHTSAAQFSKRFVALSAEQQDQILAALEQGQVPVEVWNPAQARQFFDLIVSHTMQGFYGDPRHGGNREAVSWRMLGIPVLPVRGRQQYDLTGERRGA